jgi:hypothetical protein
VLTSTHRVTRRSPGVRAALAAVGVLASVVFMAAPSWAAGGNTANAKLCETESRALVAQDGSHFKNAGACTAYAARGGQLAKLEIQIHFESECFGELELGPCLSATASGFGLKPSTLVTEQIVGPGGSAASGEEVNELGVRAPFTNVALLCPTSGVSATAEGTLASGLPITARATEPSSC